MYRDIPDDLRRLIEPVIEDHGLELVDVDWRRGRGGTLRITVDSAAHDGKVPVDVLAELSREIGTQLDAADAVEGPYRLELSSPGLDRVLGREKDFTAACGERVRVKTRRPLDGRRRFQGVLVEFAGGKAVVADGRESFEIPFDEIEKAHTVYEFSAADFRGRARE